MVVLITIFPCAIFLPKAFPKTSVYPWRLYLSICGECQGVGCPYNDELLWSSALGVISCSYWAMYFQRLHSFCLYLLNALERQILLSCNEHIRMYTYACSRFSFHSVLEYCRTCWCSKSDGRQCKEENVERLTVGVQCKEGEDSPS